MRTQEEWNDAEAALEELHREDWPFDRWADKSVFVHDMMQLMQAAYAGGYEDAMDSVRSASGAMVTAMDESLEYLREL